MSVENRVMSASRTTAMERVVRAAKVINQPTATDRELLHRFTRNNDQEAFETLVNRHTNMVLGVCRRALSSLQDAEDACQATFLVLANRAKGGRWQESVANWLYTTARKVAHNARVAAERRTRRETGAAVPEAVESVDRMTGRELLAALDAALDGLPPRYREPLVLCYLEGLTHREAAIRLGVPIGTLHTRIDRARKRLHEVLTKAGCTLGAGLLTLMVCSPAGASSPRLVKSILSTVSGSTPAAVGQLARGIAMNGLLKKTVLSIGVLLGIVSLGVALASIGINAEGQTSTVEALAGIQTPPVDSKPNITSAEQAAQPTARADKKPVETITYSGRVLGPDDKPVPGARIYMTHGWNDLNRPSSSPERTTTDVDGRFEFKAPKSRYVNPNTVVAATTANHGIGWVQAPPFLRRGNGTPRPTRTDDLTIRVVKDDVPITGQIVNLEGKPVPGATLTVSQINAAPKDDLGPWLEAIKSKKGLSGKLEEEYLPEMTFAIAPKVTTDAQGRFKLTGIGTNRLVTVRLEGPTIATQNLFILTRQGQTLTVLSLESDPELGRSSIYATYYGANFRHAAAPTRPIVGVVRDKDTKKPLAGVTIQSDHFAGGTFHGDDKVYTTTNAEGRYSLVGMPRGEGNRIVVIPGSDMPYMNSSADLDNPTGLGSITLDFELKRGIWIEGKVTNKATGQPLKAFVEYLSLADNPNLRDHPGFTSMYPTVSVKSNEDGSYRIPGLPGSGFLLVSGCPNCLRATERDDEFGMTERRLPTAPHPADLLINYNAIASIKTAEGVESARRDVTIDSGWTFKGTVLGVDGEPLSGARGYSLDGDFPPWTGKMDTAEFTVHAFNPRQPRDIFLQHEEKGLVGVIQPPKENGGSITVKMQPTATVTGRLLDEAGKPCANADFELWFRTKQHPSWEDYPPKSVRTDMDGRFRIEALAPGFDFRLMHIQSSSVRGFFEFGKLRSGEVKELGDVRMKTNE